MSKGMTIRKFTFNGQDGFGVARMVDERVQILAHFPTEEEAKAFIAGWEMSG